MNTLLRKIQSAWKTKPVNTDKFQQIQVVNEDAQVEKDEAFPSGYHVFGITQGPKGEVMVGAGEPLSGEGALFIQSSGTWTRVDLPDETAWLSQFIRLSDGSYIASGMTLLGRAAILKSDSNAQNWKSIDLDLHSYSQINSLLQLPSGELLASTGRMITQGKTKPILLRSKDQGITWTVEEVKLPITQFHTFYLDGNRIYGGTCGDHTPTVYYSDDWAVTWTALPEFPSYKTYKTMALQPILINGEKKLLAVMWGYKIDIADRVVRLYLSDVEMKSWTELEPVLDSHFIFSFYIAPDWTFYAGSEKGKFITSKDFGQTWETLAKFSTNIGAYTIYQHTDKKIWLGKDFVQPNHSSLWTVKS